MYPNPLKERIRSGDLVVGTLLPGFTPHIAGVTHVSEAAQAFLDVLTRLESGEPVPAAVDPVRGY